MRKRLTVSRSMVLAVLLTLLLAVGLTQALEPQSPDGVQPQGETGVQATVGTAFTYQGRLTDGGNPANGEYDFQFRLYDAATGGSQVGSTISKGDVTVTDGLFTVEVDFGTIFLRKSSAFLFVNAKAGSF